MSKFAEVFLAILTAMGGFVEIGELTFALNVGSQFQYQLLWVVLLGTVGILVYGEIAGRLAAVRHQGIFEQIRGRLGLQFGLVTVLAATLVSLMTCAAEIGGMALLWNLLSGWPYRALLLVACAFLLVSVWLLPFKWIERVFGLGGLLMAVFGYAAVRLHPDWMQVADGFVPRWPTLSPGTGMAMFAYSGVALFSSILLPYETYFYAAGAVEDKWKPADIPMNRIIVMIGFPLGALLCLALVIVGNEYLGPRHIEAGLPGTALLGVGSVLGRVGVLFALAGMFFAFAGAAIENALTGAYNLGQHFGWPWGKFRAPRRAIRFTLAWAGVFVLATLIVLTGVDPVRVVEYSIVCAVVILPLTYFPLMLVSGDRRLMGVHANGALANTLGWGFFGLVTLAALAAIPLLVMTHGGRG
jgi:Mn2+/Fe2+ NRAMP family transporter